MNGRWGRNRFVGSGPSGPSGHLPMNGEERALGQKQTLSDPPPGGFAADLPDKPDQDALPAPTDCPRERGGEKGIKKARAGRFLDTGTELGCGG